MIVGIGLDLVEVARVERALHRHGDRFLQRVFSSDEQLYCQGKAHPAIHLAGRFAAKEACAKALGTGVGSGVRWAEMQVVRGENGAPEMRLTGEAARRAKILGVARTHLSITHSGDNAAAVVVLESAP